MKAAIYNPYLDTLGGGERYSMAVATTLVKNGYKVYVEWKDVSILSSLEKRFSIDLSNIEVISDIKRGDGYDVCFWVSDGSVPMLRARNNLLHFQIPHQNVNGNSLMNRMKMFRINKVICNSMFTKNFVDKEYGVDSKVVYPPVDVENFIPGKKENTILCVGRFSQLTQSKRQDVLIEAFKEFYDSGNRKWKLILAGGVEVGVDDFVDKIRRSSKGYPITIYQSPSFDRLTKLYAKSKIFWSASGYGVDEILNPEKVEHFGIVTVEAMSAGCVPIVYRAGGHKEIINNKNGRLWTTIDELVKMTSELAKDRKLLENIAQIDLGDAGRYSYLEFESAFETTL